MTWQRLLPVILVVAVVAYLITGLPESFSTDLSRIGTAPLTVVAVHDINLVNSTRMMEMLDRVDETHGDRVLVLVADFNTREGRAFAGTHEVQPVTLVLFDAGGTKLDAIDGGLDEPVLKTQIDRALAGSDWTPR